MTDILSEPSTLTVVPLGRELGRGKDGAAVVGACWAKNFSALKTVKEAASNTGVAATGSNRLKRMGKAFLRFGMEIHLSFTNKMC
jgi:hypothetical protein